MTENVHKETLGFQTEVKQLLHLMIHSLYGSKEIFLRELISNASDAGDKLRFEALGNDKLYEDTPDLAIRLAYDRDARTITVSDNGVGMSRQEVIEHLGTIAKSGTREFLNRLTGDQSRDANLIGEFGVGFYSSFIVSDRVTVTTRRAGLPPDQGVRWESAGEGDYTVETVERAHRGTDVVLHLREAESELLDGTRLRQIVRRYSDHITVPILMKKESWDSAKKANVSTDEDEQVNQASALWARSKSAITEEQYHEFYKHVGHDFEPPLAHVHAKVEGRHEYTLLLFVPKRAPFDLWNREHRHGVKLYVRRVFIMDDAEQLVPAYLRFIRGVVDSSDLPLNVSREILQQSQDVEAIRTGVVKRVLGMLEELALGQTDTYASFWKEFGNVLKEGIGEDAANRDRIAKLLRFSSTKAEGEQPATGLADYVGRMKEGQQAIYYITAETPAAAAHSPHLEIFKKKDIEVLLLHDRVDEWVVAHLPEFEGKPLQSVAKGDLNLGTLADADDAGVAAKHETEHRALVDRIKHVLSERAKDVRVTRRLTDSPACLVGDRDGMSMNLERMLKAAGQPVPSVKPILEINAEHPLLKRLARETDDERFADWSQTLFDQALLAEGGQLDDPAAFVKRLNALILGLAGDGAPKIWTPGS